MNVTTIGIDLAKTVFSIHGTDQHGKVVVRKRLNRPKLLAFFAQLPVCLIGMEACSGAHYWAREIAKLGHDARIILPGSWQLIARAARTTTTMPKLYVKRSADPICASFQLRPRISKRHSACIGFVEAHQRAPPPKSIRFEGCWPSLD